MIDIRKRWDYNREYLFYQDEPSVIIKGWIKYNGRYFFDDYGTRSIYTTQIELDKISGVIKDRKERNKKAIKLLRSMPDV